VPFARKVAQPAGFGFGRLVGIGVGFVHAFFTQFEVWEGEALVVALSL
jgi:hypothetical protein